MTLPFTPRPSQREILAYRGGTLGISAVPGSGKTHTLSALAGQIISSGLLERDQEVLIVTLVNSAVDNFSARIGEFIQARGLIPQFGYRVRTLHGLAHDIVRENPPLVGLDKKFSIVDETASSSMIADAARAWVQTHPDFLDQYISPALDDYQTRRVRDKDWPDLIDSIASSFIRSAKDRRLTPDKLRLALDRQPASLSLAQLGLDVYSDYQRALAYRGAVDFDDLIRLAYEMLSTSDELLERLRYRWPFILEDESQDSSQLQEDILRLLAGDPSTGSGQAGNWVRVGDPNQAIFETFTTADPNLLRHFIRTADQSLDLPNSGRSQQSIINLANYLIDWTMTEHPVTEARDALSPPYIQPTPKGDPQSNPPDDPSGIKLLNNKYNPDQEIEAVVKSIENWIPDHKDSTVAVLTSTNDHAARVAEELKKRKIEYRELLRSTSPTRAAAGALSYVLSYLAAPDSASKLAQAYKVWRRDWRDDEEHEPLVEHAASLIRKMKNVEEYIAPLVPLGHSPKIQEVWREIEGGEVIAELNAFRETIIRWHGATVLPIDQLILTLSQDIFTSPTDLALAHKLALVLRQVADENPQWRLPELTPSLHEIARNERRFIGFSSDDAGFNPDAYKGVVVISTVHKAKGLEWDRVYLMSVNNYDYPSNQPNDRFISERWFVRDSLNLEAEALAQLIAATSTSEYDYYEEGSATRKARLDYVRERLRLLFVGITRARKELIVTWNTGRKGDATPSFPFAALIGWRESHQ
ncbi:MAG: ATP-dependent helicase [Chloroflexi bacterium]|nr:ATP-dependent helicase [Chloroflexota bacterium]